MNKILGIAILFCLIGFVNAGDCCVAGNSTGCDESACQVCVCEIDSFCCDVNWDGICASEAINPAQCGNVCGCAADVTTTTTLQPTCGQSAAPTCGGYCDAGQVCKVSPIALCKLGEECAKLTGDIIIGGCVCMDEVVEAPEFMTGLIPLLVLLFAPSAAYIVYKKRS